MKTFTSLCLSKAILAGAAILAFSGCQLFHKKSSAPSAPATAATMGQPGNVNQQSYASANGAQHPRASSATMRASSAFARRPGMVRYSSFNHLIDPWQNPMSDAIVWVQNVRQELISIELGDQAVGIPDENGNLVRLVLPPGETYGIPDYKQRPEGYGARTQIKVIILDDDDVRIGYLLSKPITWPVRGGDYWGRELTWMIREGDPIQLAPGPAPFKIPVRIQDIPATTELGSEGAPASTTTSPASPPATAAPSTP